MIPSFLTIRTFQSVSLATRLIKAGWCFYLVEAIPEYIICAFLWNIKMVGSSSHIGLRRKLALFQMLEINVLSALLQTVSFSYWTDTTEFVVCQISQGTVKRLNTLSITTIIHNLPPLT